MAKAGFSSPDPLGFLPGSRDQTQGSTLEAGQLLQLAQHFHPRLLDVQEAKEDAKPLLPSPQRVLGGGHQESGAVRGLQFPERVAKLLHPLQVVLVFGEVFHRSQVGRLDHESLPARADRSANGDGS